MENKKTTKKKLKKLRKKVINFIIIFTILFNFNIESVAQNIFFFDVIVKKKNSYNIKNDSIYDKNDSAVVDFFACVPNQLLKFTKVGDKWHASFTLTSNFIDSLSNKSASFSINKNIICNSLEEANGLNGEFSELNRSISLLSGNYKLNVDLQDNIGNKNYSNSRNISVINYLPYNFATSSILLLSGIEENVDDYTITPYLSDNISDLNDGFFAFFEVYNDEETKEVNIITEIIEQDANKVIYKNSKIVKIDSGTGQYYVKIPSDVKYSFVNNILKISLTDLLDGTTSLVSGNRILAMAQRSLRYESYIAKKIATDLSTSIRQLRYVATEEELEHIEKGETNVEKLRLFEEFWHSKDPTPHTKRNEALEEYYNRIDYANKNFKAYKEGWLTDKGQVYITLGAPLNIEQTNNSFADNRTFERWSYGNSRIIVFLDVSGFGDFRLYSPSIITDKFVFE